MKLIQISDFKIGRSIQGFYLCREKNLRHTRSGDLFLDMIFSDSTGTIPGKLWDMVDKFQDRFESGDPVAVKGRVTEFNDLLQLTVTKVSQATNKQYGKYGFSADLLIKTVKEPVNELWKRLNILIDILPNPYKKFTKDIFLLYEQKIKIIPGSVHCHPIRGGFLKHLITTAEISVNILPYYPNIDKDLVLCGMLLHDIGKALTHEVEGSHAVIGADIAKRYGMKEPVVTSIKEHHDTQMTSPEAFVVAAADAISAARPGARHDTLEAYMQRLEDLENVAKEFEGIEKVFAIQAGREVRILVNPQTINDVEAANLARDIVTRIEEKLAYPGQIKVVVIRESRVEQIAS